MWELVLAPSFLLSKNYPELAACNNCNKWNQSIIICHNPCSRYSACSCRTGEWYSPAFSSKSTITALLNLLVQNLVLSLFHFILCRPLSLLLSNHRQSLLSHGRFNICHPTASLSHAALGRLLFPFHGTYGTYLYAVQGKAKKRIPMAYAQKNIFPWK